MLLAYGYRYVYDSFVTSCNLLVSFAILEVRLLYVFLEPSGLSIVCLACCSKSIFFPSCHKLGERENNSLLKI